MLIQVCLDVHTRKQDTNTKQEDDCLADLQDISSIHFVTKPRRLSTNEHAGIRKRDVIITFTQRPNTTDSDL